MEQLGKNIPKLGFGLMRLPMLGDEVDIEQLKEMVDMFLEKGFKYFDTAYGYIGGKSEEAIGKALVERYPREDFLLATKLPAWAGANNAEEAKQMFYTSLKRTGAGYFDFYLLHNMGEARTEFFERYGIWDFVKQRKEEGLIKHIGFSFHDKADKLEKLLNEHPEAEFVQLQINYSDWLDPSVQSKKCYDVARAHGKSVVIMEPVKGGILASLPESVEGILKAQNPQASIPSWAIRFAAGLDGLITVLSGMSNVEQMRDNLDTMSNFTPLSEKEREVLDSAVEKMRGMDTVPCTGCKYCMEVCSNNIAVPGIFEAYNIAKMYNNLEAAKGKYRFAIRAQGLNPASECLACGKCEQACPQHIKIIDTLKAASEIFD